MRERFESELSRWGRFAYEHAGSTIGIVLIVVAGLLTQLPKISIDTSTEGFLKEGDPVRLTYNAFREQFGRDDAILLAVEAPEIFDLAFLEKLRAMHRDIENEVPKLVDVTSLVNARLTRGEQDELIVGDLLEEWPENPDQLAVAKQRALSNPLYTNLLLSEDGRMTTVTIETDAYSSIGVVDDLTGFDDDSDGAPRPFITGEENHEIVTAILAVVKRYDAPDFRIYMAGSPVLTDSLQTSMRRDMSRFTLLAIVAIGALLFLLFRRAAAVALALGIVILSLLSTLSIMAGVGVPLGLPTQILPSFLLAVGIGNSVHVLVIFYQRRRAGHAKKEAIAGALGHSGLPIVMTSLTTAGGLISFASAELAPIADFGIFAPVGVMMSLVMTVVLLPALISVVPMGAVREVDPAPQVTQRWLLRTGDFATGHPGAVVGVSACILAFCAVGAAQLRFSHAPMEWFPKDDYFRVSSDVINERLAGSMFLEILVDSGQENGLHEPAALNDLDEMRRFSEHVQLNSLRVGKTVSLADVVKEIHQALNENRSDFYAIPDDRLLVAQELLLFENSGSDDLEDLVDSRFQVARFTIKLPFIDAIHYAEFIDLLEAGYSRILPDRFQVTTTGITSILGRTINAVIYSMAKTYVLAFLIITPLMILLIGNVRIGLLAMIPNLAPILMTVGLMGWFGLPLDAFTLLIGSIAIGLAVDDTIHFMHNFRRYYSLSGDVRIAVRETLTSTGQALLFTSLVLSTGFLVYAFASMRILLQFGLLTAFTIVMAFLADVLLAPALMALVARRGSLPHLTTETPG
jgi:predicted RND superfamily exporter protein